MSLFAYESRENNLQGVDMCCAFTWHAVTYYQLVCGPKLAYRNRVTLMYNAVHFNDMLLDPLYTSLLLLSMIYVALKSALYGHWQVISTNL